MKILGIDFKEDPETFKMFKYMYERTSCAYEGCGKCPAKDSTQKCVAKSSDLKLEAFRISNSLNPPQLRDYFVKQYIKNYKCFIQEEMDV